MAVKPSISVAMCTCNGQAYVQEQLDSISAQTVLPIQMVVSDDASTDSTRSILESFAAKAKFEVRLQFNPSRLGVTANFEQAMRMCQGEVICLSDQDDRWKPGKLARIAAEFEAAPGLGLTFSDGDLIDSTGRSQVGSLWQRAGFEPAGNRADGAFFARLLKGPVATGASMAVSSALRDKLTPLGRLMLHDEWMTLLAAAGAAPVSWIREPLIDYRVHPGQVVGVESAGMTDKIRTSSEADAQKFDELEKRYLEIHEFASTRLSQLIPTDRLEAIRGKARSAARRARIKRAGVIGRTAEVLSMWAAGEYGQFWLGWKSAGRDLWR